MTLRWFSENWFPLLSILAIVIGGVFAFLQWNKSVKLRRSEFINQIIEKLRFNKDMAETMYLFDYDDDIWYDDTFHRGGDIEFKIDKLLSYLSYICYLINTHHVTKKESSILEYELQRACKSFQVQSYLFNIYHFSKGGNSTCSFQYLIDYGFKEKIIEKEEFLNRNSRKYPKRINF